MRNTEDPPKAKPPMERDKPYPLRCAECWKPEVWPAVIAYDLRARHDERLHTIHIPDLQVDKCRACGEILFSNKSDEQICTALRAHVGLLQPQQIRERVEALGMSPEEFAERIGAEPEEVSCWMEGLRIPSRAMDNLMRVFLELEDVRAALPVPPNDCCQTSLVTAPLA